MSGRGYTANGLKNAEDFITAEFKKNGLKEFQKNYLQSFSHAVNTFPGVMRLKFGNKILVPGKDFLISPSSRGFTGKLKVIWLTDSIVKDKELSKRFLSQNFKNCALVVDTVVMKKTDGQSTSAIIKAIKKKPEVFLYLTDNKLTWDIAMDVSNTEFIVMRKEVEPKNTSVEIEIENKFVEKYISNNIVGFVKGTQQPDSFIVFSAHYDHLGEMGKGIYFPGANDNASGISMLLSLANYYSKNPPKCSVAFIAFAGEEPGLLGSKYYTEHPLFPLSKIKFLVNMDIVGTGDEGITVVNGSVYKEAFNSLTNINNEKGYLKQIKSRGKAANSDHYFFSEKGVPAFFMYTMGGISAYHDIFDRGETLPLTEFEDLFKLLVTFTDNL